MANRLMILFLATALLFNNAQAQLREIPKEVQEAFQRQYPMATHVDFKDQLVRVDVQFVLDSVHMTATYSNKGIWKQTDKASSFDMLPADVQSGFEKSKFADPEWKVKEVAIVDLPGGAEQFRIKVEKNDLQKKYLFFNKKGRLLRDAITL